MKVKMKVSIASADFSYAPEQIVEIDEKLAKVWSEVGHCEIVEEPPQRKRGAKNADKSQ